MLLLARKITRSIGDVTREQRRERLHELQAVLPCLYGVVVERGYDHADECAIGTPARDCIAQGEPAPQKFIRYDAPAPVIPIQGQHLRVVFFDQVFIDLL